MSKEVTANFYNDGKRVGSLTLPLDAMTGKTIGEHALGMIRLRQSVESVRVDGLPTRSAVKVQREMAAVHPALNAIHLVAV